MCRSLIVALLSVSSVLGGCNVSTAPQTLSRYAPGRRIGMSKAGYDGRYRLLPAVQERRGFIVPESASPLLERRLTRGQSFGFVRAADGSLIARAADDSLALDANAAYAWQMEADAGQIDRQKTAALVIVIVAATALGLGIYAASAVAGIG